MAVEGVGLLACGPARFRNYTEARDRVRIKVRTRFKAKAWLVDQSEKLVCRSGRSTFLFFN